MCRQVFQSARQIWVWPNYAEHSSAARRCLAVSICQADLGLAEPGDALVPLRSFRVSICQADLGLAELPHEQAQAGGKFVSICQADLGLAEPGAGAVT